MTFYKHALKCAFSAVFGAGLFVALVAQSAAGGNRIHIGPRAADARQSIVNVIGRPRAIVPAVSMIPIRMTVSADSITSGAALNCTITVASVPTDGGTVLVNCDTPSAFTSPDGNWPTSIYFAPGSSTTASFTLTANSVSGSTNVNLYYGMSDADPDDPDDWTEGGSVMVEAGCCS